MTLDRDETIVTDDATADAIKRLAQTVPVPDSARAPLEYRAATTLDVDFAERVIELIVMPYEQEAIVEHRGRLITEICMRGAYDGVERRPNRVKGYRDHDLTRIVGHAVALHPSRENGLIGELRITRSPLGDETLQLAADGDLHASAGFAPMRPGGERWSTDRQTRRITKAFLGHIALVPEPAYTGAEVLSVRSGSNLDGRDPQPPTPRKDEVLARLAELGYLAP